MMRYLRVAVVALLITAAVLYVGDWLVFKLRGSPKDTLTVSLFVSASLKNEKQEIDYIGQEQWSCTHTLFPFPPFEKSQSSPCWYLRQHTNQTTTY
jgi:hypothetical protein